MKLIKYECRMRRAGLLRVADSARVYGPDQLAVIGHALLRDLPHEQVWLVALSSAHEPIGIVRLAEGGTFGAALTPADVLRPALLLPGCAAFALVHNHPSGDASPSESDRAMTRRIAEAAALVGLRLLDHLIVTRDAARWHALGERGDA